MVESSVRSRIDVAGIGEILWDMLPDGRRLGGAPANFAFHVHRLGVGAAAVSCVGQDALGRDILDSLTSWGLPTSTVPARPDYATGTVQVRVDVEGIPAYVIEENVAWDHIAWSAALADLAPTVRAVCFGTLSQRAAESRATIRRFLDATTSDCLRVCDINLRQTYFDAEVVRSSVERANVVKLNDEELPVIAGLLDIEGDADEMLAQIRERFALKLIALTRGSAGSLLVTADRRSDHPGVPAKVVDTVGAGDSFTAALVVGLLRGDDLDQINADANRTAAEVCAHAGGIPEGPHHANSGSPA